MVTGKCNSSSNRVKKKRRASVSIIYASSKKLFSVSTQGFGYWGEDRQ